MADWANENLHQGDLVAVDGRLTQRSNVAIVSATTLSIGWERKTIRFFIKFACLPISALRRSSSSSAMRNLSPIMVSFQVEA